MQGHWVYQRLLEGLSEAAFVLDAKGIIVAFNKPAEALFGWRRDDVVGDGGWRIFAGESWDALCAQWSGDHSRRDDANVAPAWASMATLATQNHSVQGVNYDVSPLPVSGSLGALITVRGAGGIPNPTNEQALVVGLLANTLFPLVHVDPSLNIVQVNGAFAELLGAHASRLFGRNIEQLPINNEFSVALTNAVAQGYAAVGSAAYLARGASNDAASYWDWCVRPVNYGANGERGAVLMMADATARVQAEAAFKKSALEWTYAMDAFEDCIYLLDLDDRVVRANKAFYTLTRTTPQDVIGRKIASIMHPAGEETPCPVCLARQQRRDTYIVMESDHPNNKTGRPNEVMVRTIRDDHGNVMGILMCTRDLSRVRQTEREFRRLHEHIHLLLSATGEGIFGLDATGACTFINRAAASMLGYEPAEIQGKDLHSLIHYARENRSEYERERCPMLKTIVDGRSFTSVDDVLWRADKTCFPVQYLSNPIFDQGRVIGAVVVFRDITETRSMTRKLDYLATHDTLTGLFNRHEFERRLRVLLDDARHAQSEHVLCYFDLDQFKIVNDTCGHAAGDELLHQLSALLQSNIAAGATFARLGGDEFGLLLENCSLPSALTLLARLRELVREYRFVWVQKSFAIGVSIGVVPIHGTLETPASIMSNADAACYLAKESGRNRVHVYQSDDAELTRRHREMQWVTRLQHALEDDQFVLFYQCIRSTTQVSSLPHRYFEILVRMQGEEGEFICPDVFLPAAERYNLMPAIDRWVVAKTLGWLHQHLDKLGAIEFCTINLSGHSLTDDAFAEYVMRELRENNVPPGKICFEITETAAVANLARAASFMRQLKALGCRFALDDFGSGMSSFAYLKNLPVDFLKIDGNFVRDIVVDPVDMAMVDAINKVGHVMGIHTIAEFVENEAIRQKLEHLGVDFVQGLAIAPPLLLDGSIFKYPTCESLATL